VTTHRKWHTLDGLTTFHFLKANGTLKISGNWATSSSDNNAAVAYMNSRFDGPVVVASNAGGSTLGSSGWVLDSGGFTLPSSSRLGDKSDEEVTCVEEKDSDEQSSLIMAYSVRGW
jgi:hypothetical protein